MTQCKIFNLYTNIILNISFKLLWLENSLGIAINQTNLNSSIPLTNYYFWPRSDVWEQIRLELNSKRWITEREKTAILNNVAEILKLWQKNTKEHIVLNGLIGLKLMRYLVPLLNYHIIDIFLLSIPFLYSEL